MATIGPTLETAKHIRAAIEAGASWFRLPCGYRQRPHLEHARLIRRVAAECGADVQLLIDLPSSRPRTGKMEDLRLEIGARVKFFDPGCGAPSRVAGMASVPLPGFEGLLGKIECGQRIWFCDGRLEFVAETPQSDGLIASLERGEIPLKSYNSICLPDTNGAFTMITAEDDDLLRDFSAAGLTPDWVALSMVSSAGDVEIGRNGLSRHSLNGARVMAKIETAAAVREMDSILSAADAIMVARGDLGPAVEFIRLPEIQEKLVAAARRAGKIVVVATQILEAFAEVGVPQRSELSGLSLLAFQGPDVIMLGKETVFSPRPIEVISFARKVLQHETERLIAARRCVPRSLAASLGPPLVVAIEGPNGVGKSRLCSLLGQRLGLPQLRGVPDGWEEPSRKLRMIRDADWLAAAMYFLSGVVEVSREMAHHREQLHVTDRSLWSTLSVHFAYDPDRLDRLLPLVELAFDRLKVPDLTIVLEASSATCARRIASKTKEEQQFDAAAGAEGGFFEREREFYHWLASQWPKVAFIDTDALAPEEVCCRAIELIRESFPCCD